MLNPKWEPFDCVSPEIAGGAMGQKMLNADNFLLPDSTSQLWVTVDKEGNRRTLAAVDWAQAIFQIRLETTVPTQLHELFEVAQAILAYGYFWYPLYAFGAGEAFRVADAAVKLKAQQMGVPRKASQTFRDRLSWLASVGAVSHEDVLEWEVLRELRNDSTHRTERTAFPGTWSLDLLERVARAVNRLYQEEAAPPAEPV